MNNRDSHFFSGEILVEKNFSVADNNKKISLCTKGINAVEVYVNEKLVEKSIWSNNSIDLSEYLVIGNNTIRLKLVNNLRNLLGPHHLEEGESYFVLPSMFIKGENFWNWIPGKLTEWNDNYCFVETTVY